MGYGNLGYGNILSDLNLRPSILRTTLYNRESELSELGMLYEQANEAARTTVVTGS